MKSNHKRNSDIKTTDLEVSCSNLDLKKAADIYKEHGCLVVRGLMQSYVSNMYRDIMTTVDEAIRDLGNASKTDEGWTVSNGSLFIPAPKNFSRDKQIMTVGINYKTSSCFLSAALDGNALNIVESIIGPNIEIYGQGQVLVKEPVGGHPKLLHQDSAYFQHKYNGPVGILTYVIDTGLENGALHVIPGTHLDGQLEHIDTFSHLGLDQDEWPWEAAVPIIGSAGDSIFFHVKTVHGSKPNYSNKARPVFINRYRDPKDFTIISGATTRKRTSSALNADKVKKDSAQYGLMARGLR